MGDVNDSACPRQPANQSSVRIIEGDPLEAKRALEEANRRECQFHQDALQAAVEKYREVMQTVLDGDGEAVRNLVERG